MATFVLVHSPLVGPLTWKPVADKLGRKGFNAVVPVLLSEEVQPPYWKRHAGAVAESLRDLPPSEPVILVAHSGAGPLLPAVRTQVGYGVVGYIFVDAALPGPDGASRLDLLRSSSEAAGRFRARAKDGLLLVWTQLFDVTDEMLHEIIPDPTLRRDFVKELRPIPLAVYEEPLPVFPGWPDGPCGYLKCSQVYDPEAAKARRNGWPVLELQGNHFHMLVEPEAVAQALVHLVRHGRSKAVGERRRGP